MGQSATEQVAFARGERRIEAHFDLDEVTSDGGLLWLAEADDELGLSVALATVVPEWRRGPVRHSLASLVRQRVFQIACGYPDQNDATTLRHDPLLQLSCDHPGVLASQPTLSRLGAPWANAVDEASCAALAEVLLDCFLAQREQNGPPGYVLLDLDSTDDPTHGEQEGSAYHGYYRQHMYHPLLAFDGTTNQLLSARLRPGNAHASRDAVDEVQRIVAAMRSRWPGVTIDLRADGGFAVPELYDFCEAERIEYAIGLIPNTRLDALAAPLLALAMAAYDQTQEPVRLIGETRYQADSWPHPRRVIIKAEVSAHGTNTRFVVTTRKDAPEMLYAWYIERGETENWVKDFKRATPRGHPADRLSCSRFCANQFRLLLHAAAYWLLDTLRRWLGRRGVPRMQLDTLRLRLIKIGGWVRQLTNRVRIHLASSHPGQPLWHLLATRPDRP
ncbi:IS1380 family transposase [soil metagenome]